MSIEKSEFSIMDSMDEQQIAGLSEELKKKMAYKTSQGKMELTFIGLKAITLKMSQKEQPLETIHSEVNLEKDDPKDTTMWFWRAHIKVRNQKTGLETEGLSECPYFDEKGIYDPFGQRKAHSKAERNAWRKQIPELELLTFMESLNKEEVKDLKGTAGVLIGACKCGPGATFKGKKCITCGGKNLS
ncbi:MAG: hypothetical protein JKY15_01830 [Deltaproteobacteria bacterium]|nr:hypothetical protein [Deltaproteobacteria bacterium]